MGGYVAGKWLQAGIEKCRGDVSDKERFLQALKDVKPANTPRGPVKLDEYNGAVANVYILRVVKSNGKLCICA